MLDILNSCSPWLRDGTRFAVATIVSATGSVPRAVGTGMAVNDDGEVAGSLSGGCVEGAVFEACRDAMETGTSRREQFGYSDADAFAVGLTCGGVLDVLIQPFYPEGRDGEARTGRASDQLVDLKRMSKLAERPSDTPAALIRRLDDGPLTAVVVLEPADFPTDDDVGRLEVLTGDRNAAHAAASQVQTMVANGQTGTIRVSPHREVCGDDYISLLVETRLEPPRLLIFGANDFSAALAKMGRALGYRVTLCDARRSFTSAARFPDADDVVVAQPHQYLRSEVDAQRVDRRTAICVLTHDPKFDIPLLQLALTLPVQYIGAMGSRRSHAQRTAALAEAGMRPEQLELLHSPIGLDLGAVTPEEVAVSITAEIVAGRNRHHRWQPVEPLSRLSGPIHGHAAEPWHHVSATRHD
ncbi:XdhC family protein [Arthrobacter castelli]|uniref:XdhC family protein n=1 Tax=Arthrobacter castelli TaxID=271431 RepID=UPI000413A36D|nr:XdhC/CoxI family protein [Arthrobacter castelli]